MDDQDKAFNALEALKFKGMKMRDLFKPGRSFFSRAASVVAALQGNSNTISVKTLLLPFILNDIYEEQQLAGSGGRDGVLAMYKHRYNTAKGGDWESVRDRFFPKGAQTSYDATRTDVTSLMGIKNVIEPKIKAAMKYISAAADIEQTLRALDLQDPTMKDLEDRRDEL
jgi:hypothetical protein